MVDVVRDNFEDLFPEIKEAIEQSAFVAIDTEFTGLYTTDGSQPSLFDGPETRYKKLKKTASQFLISQFGLTAFVQSKDDSNRYVAHTYNFSLFPNSFGPLDVRFLCQASSLEFLCQHNFDFNKFIYNGVSFLNNDQLLLVQKFHKNHNLYESFQSQTLRIIDDNVLTGYCARLEDWILTAQAGDEIEFNLGSYQAQYLLLEEIRTRFTNVHCTIKRQYKMLITKLPITNLESDGERNLDLISQEQEKILNALLGFSKVFQVLTSCKKPIVGHNVLTDLLLAYENFYEHLPESFKDFKLKLHKIFPVVYDTKLVAFEISRNPVFSHCNFFDDTNLENLHNSLSSSDAQYFALFAPSVVFSEKCYRYLDEKMPHEAGYDSFLSGFVFLRMAHMLAYMGSRRSPEGPLPFSKFLRVLKPYENLLHLSRAQVQYVNLAGADTPSIRPQWLYVTSKEKTKPLIARTLAKEFAHFSSVDVKILDLQHALVAVLHRRKAKEVLRTFRHHKTLSVRQYHPLLDSPEMKVALWCGGTAVIFSAVAVFLWKSWT